MRQKKVRIKWGYSDFILLYVFLYPITPWYITIGPFNAVNLLTISYLLFWLLRGEYNIKVPSKSICKSFWLYMIVYSIMAMFDTTIFKSAAYIISQPIFCIFLFSDIYKYKLFDKSIDVLINAAACLSVIGLVEEITRFNIFHWISGLEKSYFYTEIRLGIYRIETIFSHPIGYCAYLGFIAGLILYKISKTNNSKRILFYKIVYGLVLINAVLTMSRSTLLILMITQMVLGIKMGMVQITKKLLLFSTIGVTLLIIFSALELSFMEKINNIFYMIAAVFDDKYADFYGTSFGLNEGGVGDRFNLYGWVAEAVKGNELFGMGTSAEFSYSVTAIEKTWGYTYEWSKISIENEYLWNYFIHGMMGLISFIVCMLNTVLFLIKWGKFQKNSGVIYGERKFTFIFIMLVLVLGYIATLFAVRAVDTIKLFNILMCLLFVYVSEVRKYS